MISSCDRCYSLVSELAIMSSPCACTDAGMLKLCLACYKSDAPSDFGCEKLQLQDHDKYDPKDIYDDIEELLVLFLQLAIGKCMKEVKPPARERPYSSMSCRFKKQF